MLSKLVEEIRLFYQMAEECACRAEAAPTETLRADYLLYEQQCRELARRIEVQQCATQEKAEPRTAGRTWLKLPEYCPPGNDSERSHNGLVAIVDDDEYARAGLQALIESLGYDAETFASAEEYLASGRRENRACLILDVNLPAMSGADLQAHLLAGGCCPPVVFVTGRFQEHVQKRVMKAGALGYLTKPCSETVLLDCIGEVLRTAAEAAAR